VTGEIIAHNNAKKPLDKEKGFERYKNTCTA